MQLGTELGLAVATLGQIGLVVSITAVRAKRERTFLPLVAFFVALAMISAQPIIPALWPDLLVVGVMLLLPAYLTIAPMFWLYVVGLTNETPWRPGKKDLKHLVLAGVGLVCVVSGLMLPEETLNALILDGDDSALFTDETQKAVTATGYFVILVFGLVVTWAVQSLFYLVHILARLVGYRRRIRDLFAENDQRELGWIIGLMVFVAVIGLLTIVEFVLDNFSSLTLVNRSARAAVLLLVVWTLAIWSLRQRPGFEGRYTEDVATADSNKYQRSALDESRSSRIAIKIDNAMTHERLYLQPGLSLAVLANHLSVPPNYVSQTLNETIKERFFDYVNRHRIEAAKPMVVDGEKSILDIAYAVGFNARSSFYTAFKRVTGQTPVAYRKAAQSPSI